MLNSREYNLLRSATGYLNTMTNNATVDEGQNTTGGVDKQLIKKIVDHVFVAVRDLVRLVFVAQLAT